MEKELNHFSLYASCRLVKGFEESIIYDLQRTKYFKIPNFLYDILADNNLKSINDVKKQFPIEYEEFIDQSFDFLNANELIFSCTPKTLSHFPDFNLSWETPHALENFIMDIDKNSNHNYSKIVETLSNLSLPIIQIRLFYKTRKKDIVEILHLIANSNIRTIELIIPFNSDIDLPEIESMLNQFPKITYIIIFNAPKFSTKQVVQAILVYLTEKIESNKSCGIISKETFTCNSKLFTESQCYNTCLNKKAGIDVNGFIKNCPSMKKHYGNINETYIKDVISTQEFQKLWHVKKDDINVCKDCEFRHMCTDCRAFLKDPSDIYSQPAKCNYNPYIAKWKGEAGYVTVDEWLQSN